MTDRTMVPEGGVGRDTYAPPGNMGVVSSQETQRRQELCRVPRTRGRETSHSAVKSGIPYGIVAAISYGPCARRLN
jgi:hypothetical protein